MPKYKREKIIGKLERMGLRPKYCGETDLISHFVAPARVHLGIKTLGYLDFLKTNVVRRQRQTKDRTISYKQVGFHPRAWSFAWFPNRREAESWIELQKCNRFLGFKIRKSEIVLTDSEEFRACVQGVMSDEL